MNADPLLQCEACGAWMVGGDCFCEACGARTTPEAAVAQQRSAVECHGCGAPFAARDADGYCSVCGVRERTAPARIEIDLAVAAAVSDQGHMRCRNEDAFHLERFNGGVVAVVCDGVGTSESADVAARCAAGVASAVLLASARSGSVTPAAASADAVHAAQTSVCALAVEGDPSCTLVSALVRADDFVIASVGDSRAYWIAPNDARQLTVDDSWADEQLAAGLDAEQAAADPRARSITRWIGADAPDGGSQLATVEPDVPGRLVLCTDGLWNYVPGPAELAQLVDGVGAGARATAVAHALADIALSRGGHDNITVAVVDVRPQRRSLR